MKSAELKFIKFGDNDVIATSGGLTLSGFGDGNLTNQKMTYNGKTVDCSSGWDAWEKILSEASDGATVYRFTEDGTKSNLLIAEVASPTKTKDGNSLKWLDGTYEYNANYKIGSKTGYFVKVNQ